VIVVFGFVFDVMWFGCLVYFYVVLGLVGGCVIGFFVWFGLRCCLVRLCILRLCFGFSVVDVVFCLRWCVFYL